MRGIKIPQQYFALKRQGGLMREGGGAYLRDTTVHVGRSSDIVMSKTLPIHTYVYMYTDTKYLRNLTSCRTRYDIADFSC